MDSGLDLQRGFDHGTFTVMHCDVFRRGHASWVQPRPRQTTTPPVEHMKVGDLITPLRHEGVLIIRQWLQLPQYSGNDGGSGAETSAAFDQWLNDTLVKSSPDERRQRLLRSVGGAGNPCRASSWEDHLIPLMVGCGRGAAGDDVGARIYHQSDFMGRLTVSSYQAWRTRRPDVTGDDRGDALIMPPAGFGSRRTCEECQQFPTGYLVSQQVPFLVGSAN